MIYIAAAYGAVSLLCFILIMAAIACGNYKAVNNLLVSDEPKATAPAVPIQNGFQPKYRVFVFVKAMDKNHIDLIRQNDRELITELHITDEAAKHGDVEVTKIL